MVIGPVGWALALAVGLALGTGWAWSARHWRRAAAELERALGVARGDRPFRARRRKLNAPLLRVGHLAEAVLQGERSRRLRLAGEVEQLRVVLAGMSEGVIAIDARRRILFANGSADRLFGLDGERTVGHLILELIRSPQVEAAVDATLGAPTGAAGGGPAYRGEITLPDRDLRARAGPRTFAIHGEALPGAPPTGAVLVFHDVSDLRRLERLRQDFVANASHELKTPLAAIKAYTETLLDSALEDEEVALHFLRRIDEQADRLNQLILDLLRLARLEAGQAVFQHGPLALAATLAACVANHRERAEAKGLALTLDLGTIEPTTRVVADEEALLQVFDNLIDNAIKYTPDGGTVRVVGRSEGSTVEVAVADSGIGIPREDLHRVFERFYRVDKARSRDLGGTGLGLSIVKHVVGSLGGEVAVDSRLGAGTQFRVRLPRLDDR